MRSRHVLRPLASGCIALLTLALAGCASTPNTQPGFGYAEQLAFTDGLAGEYKIGNEQRRQLQYYVSETIHLVRAASGGQTGIRNGRLVASSSKAVDEVVVERGTAGIVLANGPHWMAVSFEQGTYLYFVSAAQDRAAWLGDEYVDDRYYLYVPNWDGQGGTVILGNSPYTATGDSARAHLLVDRESFSDLSTRQARLPGRVLYPPK